MNKFIYLVIFSFFSTGIYAQMKDLVQYVKTLQGTDSHFGLSYGNTYPTTGMPYAMHTWSAQTGKNGEGWKYQYAVDNIRGFCQSHQCSPWMSDYAVYSFMPMVGELVVNQNKRATKFSHDNEIAKPHYYKVTLNNGITTEMAPTTRGVHLRFSYPSTGDAYLVIDGYTDMSEIKIDPVKRQISGWVNNQRFVNNSKTFRSYFIVQFDKAFPENWKEKAKVTALISNLKKARKYKRKLLLPISVQNKLWLRLTTSWVRIRIWKPLKYVDIKRGMNY